MLLTMRRWWRVTIEIPLLWLRSFAIKCELRGVNWSSWLLKILFSSAVLRGYGVENMMCICWRGTSQERGMAKNLVVSLAVTLNRCDWRQDRWIFYGAADLPNFVNLRRCGVEWRVLRYWRGRVEGRRTCKVFRLEVTAVLSECDWRWD